MNQLCTLASYSVRYVQYALFNIGYFISDLYKDCPKAPSASGNEPDQVLRRLKAVLNHPIGDYAAQVGFSFSPLYIMISYSFIILQWYYSLYLFCGLFTLALVQPRVATFAAQGIITMAHYMEGAAYTVGPTGNISIRNSSMVRNFGGSVLWCYCGANHWEWPCCRSAGKEYLSGINRSCYWDQGQECCLCHVRIQFVQ